MDTQEPIRSIPELTTAIASGDTEAFAFFYDAWFDRTLAEARRSTGLDEEFCLDVVQDVMMRVIKSMKPLPSEAALFKWMRVVVRSCACDRIRADLRRRNRDQTPRIVADNVSPESLQEQMQWLHEQIGQLDDTDVHLLIMRHRFGWTLDTIGRKLGLNHGAVDRRLRKIMNVLRKRAKEDFNELTTW